MHPVHFTASEGQALATHSVRAACIHPGAGLDARTGRLFLIRLKLTRAQLMLGPPPVWRACGHVVRASGWGTGAGELGVTCEGCE